MEHLSEKCNPTRAPAGAEDATVWKTDCGTAEPERHSGELAAEGQEALGHLN